MLKAWPWRVTLSAVILGGCASSNKLCEKPGQTAFTFGGETFSAPEGCRFIDDANGPVRAITCDDGREGLAIADTSKISVGTGG